MPFANPYDDNYIAPAGPNYLGPAPVGQQQNIGVPDAPVATTNPYVATPAPPVGVPLTSDQMRDYFLNSPEYKQGLEYLNTNYKTNTDFENAQFALQQSYRPSTQTYTPETIPGSFYEQIALAKEKAAHEDALAAKALPEIMAGRGMLSSGQTGFLQGEQAYNYDMLLKDIDLQRRAREESVAQQNARGAASVAQANAANAANAAITSQLQALQHNKDMQGYTNQLAQGKYTLFTDVSKYYHDLWWDPNTNQYRGPTNPAA